MAAAAGRAGGAMSAPGAARFRGRGGRGGAAGGAQGGAGPRGALSPGSPPWARGSVRALPRLPSPPRAPIVTLPGPWGERRVPGCAPGHLSPALALPHGGPGSRVRLRPGGGARAGAGWPGCGVRPSPSSLPVLPPRSPSPSSVPVLRGVADAGREL